MYRQVFPFFYVALLFLGCTQPVNQQISVEMESFLGEFNKEIFDRYCLVSTSFGGDFEHKIKKVVLNFKSEYSLDRAKAVFLIHRICDDLLFYLNRHQDLRGFLSPKPFTRSQLEVNIDFLKEKGNGYVSAPFIANIQLKQGHISLQTFDEKNQKLVPF